MEQKPLTVRPVRLPENKILGLRASWVTGQSVDGSVTFEVDHNAGLGGTHLSISVKAKGKPQVTETIDIAPLVEAWVDQILATMEPSSSDQLDGLEEFANPQGGVVVDDA